MLENKDYQTVMDGTQMLCWLLWPNKCAALELLCVAHPSLPNYIALMSGSTQSITSDCTTCFLNQPNLADEIEASGRTGRPTWKICRHPVLWEIPAVMPRSITRCCILIRSG